MPVIIREIYKGCENIIRKVYITRLKAVNKPGEKKGLSCFV